MQVSTSAKRPSRRRKPARPILATATIIMPPVTLACRLDRNADALLGLGCHIAAERLSLRAQALREAGR